VTVNSVEPEVQVSRSSLSFYAKAGDSDYERVYITNHLPYTLNSNFVIIPNTYGGAYMVANDCSAIPAFGICGINIAFTPPALHGPYSGYIPFDFMNAPQATLSQLFLEGNNNTAPPPIYLTTTNLELVTLLRTKALAAFSISNNTAGTISLKPVVSGSPAFTLEEPCTTIAPQQTCTINVSYSPVASQIDTGSIALNFTNPPAGTPETIELQGFAPAPSQVTASGPDITSLQYVTTNIGTFQTSTVTILNGTSHTLTLNPEISGNSSFYLPPLYSGGGPQLCTNIPANGICQMPVSFAPSTVGSFTATLNVNPTNLQPGDNPTVSGLMFEGSGIPSP
jgi:hypothetical protein